MLAYDYPLLGLFWTMMFSLVGVFADLLTGPRVTPDLAVDTYAAVR